MGTDKTEKIVQSIHSSESWLKMFSDKVIYPLAFVVVLVTFISPYSVRIFWAFFLNVFFNAPKTYLTIISKAIGETMNGVVLRIAFFTFFGIYAVIYKLVKWKRPMSKSTWAKPTSNKKPASDLLSHPF